MSRVSAAAPERRGAPWRFRHRLEVDERSGPAEVATIWTGRLRNGRPMVPVACFLLGDTLVDTGIPGCAGRLARLAAERGVKRALLTHHHEDHVGGAAALAAAGVAVLASPATGALVRHPLPVRLYQRLLWGPAAGVACAPLPARVPLGRFEAEVIPAPGHAVDQVAFHVRERGWLFAGDAYVVERVRVLRGDEDFAAALATLERLAALDVEVLFCAHRPVYVAGGAALARKLEHLRRIGEEVRDLARRGVERREIARRLGGGATRGVALFSLGDVSTRNLVRSILDGPRPRPEVAARLAAAQSRMR